MSQYNFSSPGADISDALTKLMADRKAEARQEMLDKYAREEQLQRQESATEYTRGLKAQREGVELDREQTDIRNELSMFDLDTSIPDELRQRVKAAKLTGLLKPGTPDQPARPTEPSFGVLDTPQQAGDVPLDSPIELPAIPGKAPTRRASPDERKQQGALKQKQDLGKRLTGVTDRQEAARLALEAGVDLDINEYMGPKATVPTPPESVREFEYATKNGYKGTYEEYQTADANRKRPTTHINLPSPAAANRRVDSMVTQFSNSPITKRYNVVTNAVAFVDSLDPNTTSPADDQALIYAFAKAMDPDSVVREGEYATVQRYSQALKDKIGFDVMRVFDETQFLTPQAREQLIATIRSRAKPIMAQYDNHYSESKRRIEKVDPAQVDMLPEYQKVMSRSGGGVEFVRNAQGKLIRKP